MLGVQARLDDGDFFVVAEGLDGVGVVFGQRIENSDHPFVQDRAGGLEGCIGPVPGDVQDETVLGIDYVIRWYPSGYGN